MTGEGSVAANHGHLYLAWGTQRLEKPQAVWALPHQRLMGVGVAPGLCLQKSPGGWLLVGEAGCHMESWCLSDGKSEVCVE